MATKARGTSASNHPTFRLAPVERIGASIFAIALGTGMTIPSLQAAKNDGRATESVIALTTQVEQIKEILTELKTTTKEVFSELRTETRSLALKVERLESQISSLSDRQDREEQAASLK